MGIRLILTFLSLALVLFLFLNNTLFNKNIPPTSKTKGSPSGRQISIVAENLEIPWSMVFLPDGRLLVSERPGKLKMLDNQGKLLNILGVPQVKHIGEGGLLGITIHPNFAENFWVYLYYTFSGQNDNTLNRVSRMKLENLQLTNEEILIDNIPGSSNHNGGRIKFGPDRLLYITTGDTQNSPLAQNKNSLAGKILRATDQGLAARDNPFGNLVYTLGHRNPQGISWDKEDRLWATEHGRSGIQSGLDEINLIEKGKNYGWPEIQGDERREGMQTPVLNSGSNTWAPAGAAFFGNSLFFGGLRGNALFEAKIQDSTVELKEYFKGEFGRIRDVVLGPDGFFYIATSNRDGRGTSKEGDDKIIRLSIGPLAL